jgi:hypothetical protein
VSELLRYRYEPGETYVYVQEVSIILEAPDQPEVVDCARVEVSLEALERHPDRSVTLIRRVVVGEQPRILAALPDEETRCRLSRRGELVEASPAPPPLPFLVFPVHPVEPKKAWKSVELIGPRQVAMTHTLGFMEAFEGESVAHLVSEGSAVGEPAIEFLAVRLFSIARGRPLVQRTMTRYLFSDLGTSTLVVEERARGEEGLVQEESAPEER